MLAQQSFSGAKLLLTLVRSRKELARHLLTLSGQLPLFPLALLLPKLLCMAEGRRLPIDLEPPLTNIVFLQLQLLLALPQLLFIRLLVVLLLRQRNDLGASFLFQLGDPIR